MFRWLFPVLVVFLMLQGCSRPAPTSPAIQSGDLIRPQIEFAPRSPWTAGTQANIAMLVQVHRSGQKPHYLNESNVNTEEAVMKAKVTFTQGDVPLGEPLEVPFVRDC